MARQYAPRAVLRQLPLQLITTFLGVQGIHVGLEWNALVDGDTNALYRAWGFAAIGPNMAGWRG